LHPLETYLTRLGEIRATERGTPELSYRAALENLLNAGWQAKPRTLAHGHGQGYLDFLADTGYRGLLSRKRTRETPRSPIR
jgi:hypothetical protein